MIKNISIRIRITIITVILLTTCSIGLTFLLNKSAYRMADEMIPIITIQNPIEINDQSNIIDIYKHPTLYHQELYPKKQFTVPAETLIAAKNSYQVSSYLYMFIFIILGGFITYVIMGKALNPLSELSKQMKNTSVKNLYNEIPLTNTKDEIYELTLSFNNMMKKLNESFHLQKRFSQSAAHELRTPLTTMRTKLDVFKKRNNPNIEDYRQLVDSINNQITRLSDIVNSLLCISNMDDIDLVQSIQLKPLIESVCIDLYSITEKNNVSITINGDNAFINGNYELIYRAFYNLIENSIKYNHINGTVDIIIEENDFIKIQVIDSGIGIPDEMRENVFEAFFTVDKSRSRKLGGAGIGLSIVKKIIDIHNGTINITDNIPKGCIFTINFNKQKEC